VSEGVSSKQHYVPRGVVGFLADKLVSAIAGRSLSKSLQEIEDFIAQDPAAFERIMPLLRDSSLRPAHVLAEPLNPVAATPAKVSVTRRPPMQLVVLVLIWLILVAGPLAEGKLPSEIQTMLGTEVGTVALGLAITQAINQKRK
jgi:hypothetical protein